MTRRIHLTTGYITATCLLFAVAGCGSKSSNASGSATTTTSNASVSAAASAASSSGGDCSAAPASLVGQFLGITYGNPKASKSGDTTTCVYTAGDSTIATITINHSSSTQAFQSEKASLPQQGTTTFGLDGVGDDGFGTIGYANNDPQQEVDGVTGIKGNLEVSVSTPHAVDESNRTALVNHLLGVPTP